MSTNALESEHNTLILAGRARPKKGSRLRTFLLRISWIKIGFPLVVKTVGYCG
jgi:hypothetical protein